MISVIVAAAIGCSLYFSMNGALWATQVIIAILAMNVFLVLYSLVLTIGFQRTLLQNPQKRIEELDVASAKMDVPVILLLRVFLLICVWHLFTLGYVFFAGMAATTVGISMLITVFRSIDAIGTKAE